MLVTLGWALTVALAATLALIALAWWAQERIVFQPSGPPFPEVRGARRAEYRADDGQPLFALVVGEDSAARARGAVLAFHGNADLAVWQVPWAEEVARRTGCVVVLAEYRGYGGLPGPPTAAGVRRDALAALGFVRDELRPPVGRIVLYGHSLGSAVAAELAPAAQPAALVLVSPFTSARAMARVVAARPVELAWSLISRIPYDTEARVRELDAPVWVAHGERDFIIPVRMGRAVYAAARRKGELLIIPRAGHNDVVEAGGEEYWGWLERALTAGKRDIGNGE